MSGQPHRNAPSGTDEHSAKILAKSFFRMVRGNGYTHRHVVEMASELLALVSEEIRAGARSASAAE